MRQDEWFERLAAAAPDDSPIGAPASLKSKIYSTVVTRLSETGSLLDLVDTKAAGGRLCVFEAAMTVVPLARSWQSMNPCRICHARVLAERMKHAPIFWPGCPYSEFHNP